MKGVMKTTVITFVCILLQSIAVTYAQDYPPDLLWNDAAVKFPFDFFDIQTTDFTWTDKCIEHPTNKGGSEEAYRAFGQSMVLVFNDPRLGDNVEKLMLFNSNANIPMSNCTSLVEASQSITFGDVYPNLVDLDSNVAIARDAFLARISDSDSTALSTEGEGIEEPAYQEEVEGYQYQGRGACLDQNGKLYSYLQRTIEFPNAETCGKQECERFANLESYRGFEFSVVNRCTCLFDIDDISEVVSNEIEYVSKQDLGQGPIIGTSGTPGSFCYSFVSTNSITLEDGIEEPADDEVSSTALPKLTLPEGGLNKCNEPIPSEFPDNIIPKEVVAGILQGLMQQFGLDELATQMESLALYDVRVHKICTSCEEMNKLWDEESNESNASEVMPYCVEGSFAFGRTMSGLLLEPIDSVTKEPIVGKIATTIYNYPTETNPFIAPSQTWPLNVATNPPEELGALAAASAGTYTIVPDVLGLGEDWEGVRSYIVKTLYSASAVPLLLKAQDIVKKSNSCTEMDKRVAIMGYSEGGYATVAISDAIDTLNDGYEQTYLGVGGAPIKISTEQLYMIVEGAEGTFLLPQFAARIGNAYSSTNGDLVNTDKGQEMASDEFLNPNDEAKNVISWAKAGLNFTELLDYMPLPPDRRMTDVVNPAFVDMVLSSFEAGNTDPCNSEFKTDDVDLLCQALIDNDISELVENIKHQTVICHSPDDDIVYYSNVPDTTLNDNLIMIEDLPGVDLQVTGDHVQAGGICFIGFLFPFLTPPETSNVRSIMPLDDAGLCRTEDGDDSPPEEGESTITTKPTTASKDDTTDEVDANDGEDTDGLGFVDEEVPSESAASSSFGSMRFTFLLAMPIIGRLWTL